MNGSRQSLIADLVGDLKPVKRPGKTGRLLMLWLAAASIYSAAIVWVTGPLRDGALAALVTAPLYGVELGVATIAIALLAWGALRMAIPSSRPWRVGVIVPVAALTVWVALLVGGLLGEPALGTAMLGKRDHCFFQTVLFGVPSAALLLFMVRRLLPLWPRSTAGLAGAAAAALPAMLMQLGCMYEPGHALLHHLSAVPVVAAVGALAAPFVLRRRAVVPRNLGTAVH